MDNNKIFCTWWLGVCYHKEQLELIINSPDVRTYAWILHDKDILPDGQLKKPHYHFLLQFLRTQRGSWFKRFNSDDMGMVFPEPTYSPQGAFDYLIHNTPKSKKDGKYLYDPSERISIIENFETEEKPDDNAKLFDDLMLLLNHELTWHEMLKRNPKRIHMISNIKTAYDVLYNEMYGK